MTTSGTSGCPACLRALAQTLSFGTGPCGSSRAPCRASSCRTAARCDAGQRLRVCGCGWAGVVECAWSVLARDGMHVPFGAAADSGPLPASACAHSAPSCSHAWHVCVCACMCAHPHAQVRWLARLSDPWVRFVDKIVGEAVVSVRASRDQKGRRKCRPACLGACARGQGTHPRLTLGAINTHTHTQPAPQCLCARRNRACASRWTLRAARMQRASTCTRSCQRRWATAWPRLRTPCSAVTRSRGCGTQRRRRRSRCARALRAAAGGGVPRPRPRPRAAADSDSCQGAAPCACPP
jgi:hypothetical protein